MTAPKSNRLNGAGATDSAEVTTAATMKEPVRQVAKRDHRGRFIKCQPAPAVEDGCCDQPADSRPHLPTAVATEPKPVDFFWGRSRVISAPHYLFFMGAQILLQKLVQTRGGTMFKSLWPEDDQWLASRVLEAIESAERQPD